MLKTLARMSNFSYVPAHSLALNEKMSPQDRQVLEAMGIIAGELGIVPTFEKGSNRGVLVAIKSSITPADMEALSFFALHAGLIMDNLSLSVMYQNKTQRISLLYEIGKKLALASTLETRKKAALETMESLTNVLRASEISLYSYSAEDQALKLMAFTSKTANADERPLEQVEVSQSKVMGHVVQSALEEGLAKPLVINEFPDFIDTKPRGRYETDSYLGIPLMVGEELLGIMNITDKKGEAAFDQADLELATAAANMLASALYNNNLLDHLGDRALEAYYKVIQTVESEEGGIKKGHSERVANLAKGIAEAAGLENQEVELTCRAASLHDIGKFITGTKAEGLKGHPQAGADLLGDWLGNIRPGVLWHHEREDGQGFPDGLKNAEIPEMARIIAVANSFDNLYLSPKPGQRPALAEALLQMLEKTGSHFNQEVVEALFQALIMKKLTVYKRPLGLGSKFIPQLIEELSDQTRSETSRHIGEQVRTRFLSILSESTP
ncbi:MAG: GAF domain-containing protein [Deltaproteobacteria bacterium]|nr:GAF domain-containing protein [Deltaproteobacteria bacterium]